MSTNCFARLSQIVFMFYIWLMVTLIRENKLFFSAFFMLVGILSILQLVYTKAVLFLWVNNQYTFFGDVFFIYYTHVGDGWVFAALFIACCFFSFRLGITAALTFAITGIASQFLKRAIFYEQVRPKAWFSGVADIRFVEGVSIHTQHSFPSGHTITAFALFTFLAMAIPNKKWGIVFFVMAFLVGYSRVYLAQHFVADAFAGAIIGTMLTLICFSWVKHWSWLHKNWAQQSVVSLIKGNR